LEIPLGDCGLADVGQIALQMIQGLPTKTLLGLFLQDCPKERTAYLTKKENET
jgi:hypothetical protein